MSRRKPGRTIALGAVALLTWLLTQDIAFAMARGGDGWDDPFYLSLVLVVFYPGAFFLAFAATRGTARLTLGLLAIAVALDLVLLDDILFRERNMFLWVWKNGPGFAVSWIALWLGWQVLAVASLHRHRMSD